MKEIIYLDTEIVNSILAQLNNGITNGYTIEKQNQTTATTSEEESSTDYGKATVQARFGIPAIAQLITGGDLANNSTQKEGSSEAILSSQKDILNKVFHDQALNILISQLQKKDLLKDSHSAKEGDLNLIHTPYKFYDFNLIKNAVDPDFLSKLMNLGSSSELKDRIDKKKAEKIVEKLEKKIKLNDSEKIIAEEAYVQVMTEKNIKEAEEAYLAIGQMSNYANVLLKDSTLITAGNKTGLLKREFLKESIESLSFRADKERKVQILYRTLGIKNNMSTPTNMPEFLSLNKISDIPNMMLDILLSTFGIMKDGDILITPIAIYYE